MTPRTTTNTRATHHEAFRAELLSTLEELLAEGRHVSDISIERLVSAAGTSRTRFYKHFPDRGRLLSEIMTELMLEVTRAARRWWNLPPEASFEQLHGAVEHMLLTYHRHAAIMSEIVGATEYEPEVHETYRRLMSQAEQNMLDTVTRGQAGGHLRPGPAADLSARWVTWMVERGINVILPGLTEDEVRHHAHGVATLLWFALYQGSDRPTTGPSTPPS